MCDAMSFPATVEEFMEKYKIVDREEVYTNGAEMVPIFRMKQWFEHEASQNADTGKMVGDCISRQAAIDALNEQIEQCNKALGSFDISLKDEFAIKVERASLEAYKEQLENLPTVQPESCEGCKHLGKWENEVEYGYPSPCTRCKRRAEDHYER